MVMEISGERYRMLDTVRHYAAGEANGIGEDEPTSDDQASRLSIWRSPRMRGRNHADPSRQMAGAPRLERENLLSAHAWCLTSTRSPRSWSETWLRRIEVLLDESRAAGSRSSSDVEALARPDALSSRRRSKSRLMDAGQLCCFMGRYAEAQSYLEESLAIAREIGDSPRVAAVLQPLGMACLGLGDASSAARDYLEEAVALARAQRE